ncbi:hypothetical protein ATO67_21940 [Agrobacterium bohemicum]|uniref:Uncharacterized protein n=1 Tax=Agrobacterium bohemicum TaxID=2052828 RepID=A0A135P697_9HYPH|nr:hypothetical protein ATO67_21940 [Agrobacterium bohemicum]
MRSYRRAPGLRPVRCGQDREVPSLPHSCEGRQIDGWRHSDDELLGDNDGVGIAAEGAVAADPGITPATRPYYLV